MSIPGPRSWGRRAALTLPIFLLIVVTAAAGWGGVIRVSAHAFLDRSDPTSGAVLPETPAEMRIWFTEPLEPAYTSAELYDADGNLVQTDASRIGDEPNLLVLPLPAGLARGTYTVQWRNVSATDGHPQTGYVPFTIGTNADVAPATAPKLSRFSDPPAWLDATGRWLSLLGVTGAVGALVAWLWVVRVARDPLDDEVAERVQSRVETLVLASLGLALAGSVVALSVQAASSGEGYGPGAMLDILQDTRYGHLWLLRVLLLFVLAAATTSASLWDDPPSIPVAGAGLALGAGVLIPFALTSHAAAPGEGRMAAIAADWLHLAASSVWVGGLLALLVALVYGTRGVAREDRREAFAIAIPRFSTLAIASVVLLALTGFYSSWLHVGNLTALRETSYGQTLLVKLALLVPLLALGAVNLRFVGPRMRANARSGMHFGRTIAAEAMLGVGILFAVGLLTSLPTARETVTAAAERTSFHFAEDDAHAVLYISPGAAGVNQYIADVGFKSQADIPTAQVLLRVQQPEGLEGVREVVLTRSFGNRFEASGAELSVVGDWDLELILRRPNAEDTRFTATLDVPKTPPAERVPGEPPRFANYSSALAMLFIGIAVVAFVVSLRMPGVWQDRAVGTAIGIGLALAGVAILGINRFEPTPDALATNPVPATAESIAAGQSLFAQYCTGCHGDTGEGNGPLAPTLARPPANLTEGHVAAHTDGDLHWWIANGIDPAMPGFGDQIEDEEIWDIVNFVRTLGTPVAEAQ